jgi:hypothetical protein
MGLTDLRVNAAQIGRRSGRERCGFPRRPGRRSLIAATFVAMGFVGAALGMAAALRGTAERVPHTFLLVDVACSPSRACTAVGVRFPREMVSVSIRSDGSVRRRIADSSADYATGVACPTVRLCLAVGQVPGVGRQHTRYEIVPIRDGRPERPQPVSHTYLYGISCGSPTDCWAFGADRPPWTGNRGNHGRLVNVIDGRVRAVYRLHGVGPLMTGACLSSTRCLALTSRPARLVQVDAGVASQPRRLFGLDDATHITCMTSTSCFVVGDAAFSLPNGSPAAGLVISLTAGRPTAVHSVPHTSVASAIACSSPRRCVVFAYRFGNQARLSGGIYNYAVPFDGHGFGRARRLATNQLNAAECRATGCVAVGSFVTGLAQKDMEGLVYRYQ